MTVACNDCTLPTMMRLTGWKECQQKHLQNERHNFCHNLLNTRQNLTHNTTHNSVAVIYQAGGCVLSEPGDVIRQLEVSLVGVFVTAGMQQ